MIALKKKKKYINAKQILIRLPSLWYVLYACMFVVRCFPSYFLDLGMLVPFWYFSMCDLCRVGETCKKKNLFTSFIVNTWFRCSHNLCVVGWINTSCNKFSKQNTSHNPSLMYRQRFHLPSFIGRHKVTSARACTHTHKNP